jgi:hypothetical protein
MDKFERNSITWQFVKALCFLFVFQLTAQLVSADGARILSKENTAFDECAQKRTVLTRVTNELKVVRRTIKNSEIALVAKQRDLKASLDYAGKLEIGRQAVSRDSYKRAALDRLYSNADASVRLNQRQVRDIEARLEKQRGEETYLVNQLHLIRDYVDENCAAVTKPKPKPAIPNIAGNYNSPYGRTVITQEIKPEGVFVTATVYYDGGDNSPSSGTSRLSGFFDGKTWRFNWRNTLGHHGTGVMGYNADEGFSGYWLNVKDKSRGNWWLRPR